MFVFVSPATRLRGFVGEGDGQNVAGRNALAQHHVLDSSDEGCGFAGAGAGEDHERNRNVGGGGGPLLCIETAQAGSEALRGDVGVDGERRSCAVCLREQHQNGRGPDQRGVTSTAREKAVGNFVNFCELVYQAVRFNSLLPQCEMQRHFA